MIFPDRLTRLHIVRELDSVDLVVIGRTLFGKGFYCFDIARHKGFAAFRDIGFELACISLTGCAHSDS